METTCRWNCFTQFLLSLIWTWLFWLAHQNGKTWLRDLREKGIWESEIRDGNGGNERILEKLVKDRLGLDINFVSSRVKKNRLREDYYPQGFLGFKSLIESSWSSVLSYMWLIFDVVKVQFTERICSQCCRLNNG